MSIAERYQKQGQAVLEKLGVETRRDIKPASMMLRRDSVVKVLDFGLARLVGAQAHLDAPGFPK
jgi:serine/threonine protein kinase